jgi:hypothetical protein
LTISIPHEVARRLGYYVYMYVDPRSDRPFYVGKGQGDACGGSRLRSMRGAHSDHRILAHLAAQGDPSQPTVSSQDVRYRTI